MLSKSMKSLGHVHSVKCGSKMTSSSEDTKRDKNTSTQIVSKEIKLVMSRKYLAIFLVLYVREFLQLISSDCSIKDGAKKTKEPYRQG